MSDFETFVFMDLESTGLLRPDHRPRITELCFLAVHRLEMLNAHRDGRLPRVVNKINLTFDPGEALQPGVPELTGLNPDNLSGQSRLDELSVVVMDAFIRRLASPVCLLAHNGLRFDYPLLQAELNLLKTSFSIPNLQCVDTLDMFRALDGLSPWQLDSPSLATAVGNSNMNGNNNNRHSNAVDDDKTLVTNVAHDCCDKDKENEGDMNVNNNGCHDNAKNSNLTDINSIPYKPKHRRSVDAGSPSSDRRKVGKTDRLGPTPSPDDVHSSSCDSDVTTSNKTSQVTSSLKRKAPSTPPQSGKPTETKSIKRRLFEKYSKETKEREEKEKEQPKPRSSPENLSANSTCVSRSGGRKYLAAALERQGTIILWHDHFNEDFFREHLEITDKRSDDSVIDSPSDKSKLFSRNSLSTVTAESNGGVTVKTVTDFSVRNGKFLNGLESNGGVLHGLLVATDAPSLVSVDRKDTGQIRKGDASAPVDLTTRSPRSCPQSDTSQNSETKPKLEVKTSYRLEEVYRRIMGHFPVRAHTAEDDSMALLEMVCREFPRCGPWITSNYREFSTVQPMY